MNIKKNNYKRIKNKKKGDEREAKINRCKMTKKRNDKVPIERGWMFKIKNEKSSK